jgi:hypothetical protein
MRLRGGVFGGGSHALRSCLVLEPADFHVNHQTPRPHPGYLDDTGRLLIAAGSAGGNLVTDARIAALAIASRGVVHTSDRDFLRFPGLKTYFPLDAYAEWK